MSGKKVDLIANIIKATYGNTLRIYLHIVISINRVENF